MQSLSQELGLARTFGPRLPANAPQAREMIARGVAARFIAWARKCSIEEIVAAKFGGNRLVQKAAVNPAMTNVPDWAGDLVGDAIGPFMALAPQSAYSQLTARGARLSFTSNGKIVVAGNIITSPGTALFVPEGAPIPVVVGNVSPTSMEPRKAAAIAVATRELQKATPLTVATLFAQMLGNFIALHSDAILLGNGAGSASQPGGIGENAIVVPATATGTPEEKAVTDLHNMVAELSKHGGLISPVFIMSQANKVALDLMFGGHDLDIIASPALVDATATTVYLVDAASFASAEGDTSEIDISEEATLHMEDAVPLPIVDGATASPVRSLWQTASVGVRVINHMDWAMTGANRVAVLTEEWFGTP